MTRKICITAVDGNTGFLIAELILKNREFSKKADAVIGLALDPNSAHSEELKEAGASIVPHVPGRVGQMTKSLQKTGCDTICLVPPAHKDKMDMTEELVEAAKRAGVTIQRCAH